METISSTRQLWQMAKLLFSWSFLSNGFNTLVPLVVIFGTTKLGLTELQLLIVAIIVPISAVIGIYFLLFLQKSFNLTTKTMMIFNTTLYLLIPIYTLLGFKLSFGLNQKWEVWIFVVYFGIILGAIQNYYQIFFSSMIPKGCESEFFSISEIISKVKRKKSNFIYCMIIIIIMKY